MSCLARPPSADRRDPRSTALMPLDPDLGALGDQALLALLLSRSTEDAEALAERLIARFGDLGAVLAADRPELVRTAPQAAVALIDLRIARELAIRLARAEASKRPVISSWTALLAYVRVAMAHRPREQFRVLFLDHRNGLMLDELCAEDPTVQAAVDRRIERLLDATAARIVAGRAVHNGEGRPPDQGVGAAT